jgi:SNF2 family DNA or RNA helicase
LGCCAATQHVKIKRKNTDSESSYEIFADGGFTFLYDATIDGNNLNPLDSRQGMAKHFSTLSAKIQFMIKKVQEVVVDQSEKLIIFSDWPLNIFVMNLVLRLLEFKVESIRSGVSPAQRKQTLTAFNSRNNKGIEILLCSSRSASESINLQKGAHNILIMDVVNYNTIL